MSRTIGANVMSIDDIIRLATELPPLGVSEVTVGDVSIVFGAAKGDEPGWDEDDVEDVDDITEDALKFHSAGY